MRSFFATLALLTLSGMFTPANAADEEEKPPVEITKAKGYDSPEGFSYMKRVQPVLDRYCIKCHGLKKSSVISKSNAISKSKGKGKGKEKQELHLAMALRRACLIRQP